jgi:ABC-2 type transport system permease protein
MKKILYVARREFLSTVMTKGFILGMLITPALIGLVVVVFPRIMNRTPPKVVGEIAIMDPTGQITAELRAYLQPERFLERRVEEGKKLEENTPEAIKRIVAASPQGQAAMQQQAQNAYGEVPQLQLVELSATGDVEQAKAPLRTGGGTTKVAESRRLALIVVHPDAVHRAEGKVRFGTYELFVRSKVDDRLEDELRSGMRDAIVDARIRESGMRREEVEALTRVDKVISRTVTQEGERTTNEVFNMMLPAAFMILLLISSVTSGQLLLTTTVEEKASRVVEVLLSAVSPMELMTGKILGHMAVGFLVLILYAGLGIVALSSFAMLGLLDPMLLVFLLIFFVLAYFTFAALMAAIGSAVNEMKEAQSMMTPVMLIVMLPWILWMPISRDPNSVMAIVLSFIPPLGNFTTLLRMTSTSPPPMWQVGLSILINAAGAVAALWAAAKVFRIGLLMFGKPPSFRTLLRWIKMA